LEKGTRQVEEIGFAVIVFAAFAIFVVVGLGYSEIPRTVPLTVSIPGLILAGVQLVRLVAKRGSDRGGTEEVSVPIVLPSSSDEAVREMVRSVSSEKALPPESRGWLDPKTKKILSVWAWIVGLAVGIDLAGFLVTTPIFLCSFVRFVAKRSWAVSAGISAGFTVAMYLIFYVGLKAQL
jgi:hypothetical protein